MFYYYFVLLTVYQGCRVFETEHLSKIGPYFYWGVFPSKGSLPSCGFFLRTLMLPQALCKNSDC